MKSFVAFALGIIVAAGAAYIIIRRDQPPAAVVESASIPATAAPAAPATPEAPSSPPSAVPSTPVKPSPVSARKPSAPLAQNRPYPSAPESHPPAPPATENRPAPIQPGPPPSMPPQVNEPAKPPAPRTPHMVTLAAGTLLSVRLGETLSTDRNETGDSFTATLDQPLIIDGFVIAERGANLKGRVVESLKAGRVKGLSQLALELTEIKTGDGQQVAVQTEPFRKSGEATRGEDAVKVGAAAGIGAAIGAIAGGGKGAAVGAAVGGVAGGGGVAATRGKATELPVETRISFKLREAVNVTERLK